MLTPRHSASTLLGNMRTEALDYDLPEELIATRPAEPRDASRLLVCSRTDAGLLEHARFSDLPGILAEGDVLVFNRSAVLPARLTGLRSDTAGKAGGLFLAELAPGRWRCLLHITGKLREGISIELTGAGNERTGVTLTVMGRDPDEGWVVAVDPPNSAGEVLERAGTTPLPPYILSRRRALSERIPDEADRLDYQTVYADPDRAGSVAAPTAGLHFTDRVLESLRGRGVVRTAVTLHVGSGTFKPIEADDLNEHTMHREWIEVPFDALDAIDRARAHDRRVLAVGTTAVRAIESVPADHAGDYLAETELFITPGYRFVRTDGLVTNFHLPRSTLIAMVGALFDGGVPRLIELYRGAIEEGYRFYSYGDAMLILP